MTILRLEDLSTPRLDALDRERTVVLLTVSPLETHGPHLPIGVDAFTARQNADHFARLVENADIAANGYNIAVSSYVEQADTSETVNIRALNAKIACIVARQAELRAQIDAIVADLEGGPA